MKPHWHDLLKLTPFLVGQFGFDFGSLAATLEGYFAAFLNFLLQIVVFIWNVLVYVAQYIWTALNFIGNFFYQLALDVGKAFKWIWANVIKAGLTKLISTFLKVRQWLSNLLSPILRWIKLLRALYDQYFNQFVKPILKILRQMRQVLQVFKLLGFKWAARLDADIARIEGKIVALYTQLRAYLNIATTWIQLIIDPTGILRRNPLFAAIIRSAPELRNLMDAVTVHQQTQQEVDKSNRANGWFLPAARAENMSYYKQGKLPPDLEAARQEFLDAYAALPGRANQSLV